jgi:hypothetical protein
MFLLLLFAALAPPSSATALDFPAVVGAVWEYQVAVEWTLPNSNQVRKANVIWQTKVVTVRRNSVTTVVVLRGFPTDLCWYEPDRTPTLTVLTIRPEGLYLNTPDPQPSDANALADATLLHAPVGERVLGPDPHVGDCLGGTPRPDRLYCWHVERQIQVRGRTGWAVAYRTNPDHQVIEFVPGLGVSAFEFVHHGTVASAHARLVSTSLSP